MPARRPGPADSVEGVLRLAQALLKGGRYEEALGPLRQATKLVPGHPAILNDLGMACLFTRRLPEAVTWLRQAIAAKPSVARTHFNLGLALAQTGDSEGALAAHLRAVALDPRLAEAHGRVADILLRKGRRADAAAAYERAASVAPESTFGQLCQAKALAARDRPEEAEVYLRQVVAGEAASGEPPRWRAEAHLALANLMNEAGRFHDAAHSFECSLALAPWQATAYQGLVSSRRLTEADRPLVARIVARLEAKDVAERQQMTLHFAAGKALDDLGDYTGAIEHFDAANRIRRTLSAFDRGYLEGRIGRFIGHYTRELFAESAALGDADETPVLVLGMPRSGTTLIERIVASHPKVRGGGELVFWNEQGSAWADAETGKLAEAAPRIRAEYLQVLRSVGPVALRVTDKMPFNFLWVGLVHLLFPRARIVHCRRNPIDTCLSIYFTQFSQSWGYASERGDLVFYYRQYQRLMDHWRAVLPPDRLLEVDYEEATARPEETARRLVAFIGLPWDPACLRPERNADAVRTASKWQARQPNYRNSVERWRHYEPWLGELRELLAPAVSAACR